MLRAIIKNCLQPYLVLISSEPEDLSDNDKDYSYSKSWPEFDPSNDNVYTIILKASEYNDANTTVKSTATMDLTVNITDRFNLTINVTVKTLNFSWDPVIGNDGNPADFYKLYEDPKGNTDFNEVPGGDKIEATEFAHGIVVYRYDDNNAHYRLEAYRSTVAGDQLISTSDPLVVSDLFIQAVGYVKRLTSQGCRSFGTSVSVSNDGSTLAVSDFANTFNDFYAGIEVKLYTRSLETTQQGADKRVLPISPWKHVASVTAANTVSYSCSEAFGRLSLSSDGSVLVVGVPAENNDGAVFVYQRPVDGWSSMTDTNLEYLKLVPPNPGGNKSAGWGWNVTLSGDGSVLVVGDHRESNDGAVVPAGHGGVYIYLRPKSGWPYMANYEVPIHLKAPRTYGLPSYFGGALSLNRDGSVLAIGAYGEGQNGDGTPGGAVWYGAVYVYQRPANGWRDAITDSAYLRAPNTEKAIGFGLEVELSNDGGILAVGAAESGLGVAYVYQSLVGGWGGTTTSDYTPGYLNPEVIPAGPSELSFNLNLSGDGTVLALATQRKYEKNGHVKLYKIPADGWVGTTNIDYSPAHLSIPNGTNNIVVGNISLSLSSNGAVLAVGADHEDYNYFSTAWQTITAIPSEMQGSAIQPIVRDNTVPQAGAVYLY